MAKSSYKGAIQVEGITGNQSGDNLTIQQCKNGVIKVLPYRPKRKRINVSKQ